MSDVMVDAQVPEFSTLHKRYDAPVWVTVGGRPGRELTTAERSEITGVVEEAIDPDASAQPDLVPAT